jgi:hypothetical protein
MPAALPLSRGGQAVQNLSGAALQRPAPQAALSIEISRLVARVLKGESIDTAASGDELAFRFPDAGMTGTMIAEAIQRAAGMVGMIREGGVTDTSLFPKRTPAFDDELAAAIDAEIGEIVAGQSAEAALSKRSAGDAGESGEGPRGFTVRGAVAAVRRSFFRSRTTP